VLAVCSAAAAGDSPKWMTYLPTQKAGVKSRHQTQDKHKWHPGSYTAELAASAMNSWQKSTCVCEQLFAKALEVAVDQRQNACELATNEGASLQNDIVNPHST
jgi:hypothetical protein